MEFVAATRTIGRVTTSISARHLHLTTTSQVPLILDTSEITNGTSPNKVGPQARRRPRISVCF